MPAHTHTYIHTKVCSLKTDPVSLSAIQTLKLGLPFIGIKFEHDTNNLSSNSPCWTRIHTLVHCSMNELSGLTGMQVWSTWISWARRCPVDLSIAQKAWLCALRSNSSERPDKRPEGVQVIHKIRPNKDLSPQLGKISPRVDTNASLKRLIDVCLKLTSTQSALVRSFGLGSWVMFLPPWNHQPLLAMMDAHTLSLRLEQTRWLWRSSNDRTVVSLHPEWRLGHSRLSSGPLRR